MCLNELVEPGFRFGTLINKSYSMACIFTKVRNACQDLATVSGMSSLDEATKA